MSEVQYVKKGRSGSFILFRSAILRIQILGGRDCGLDSVAAKTVLAMCYRFSDGNCKRTGKRWISRGNVRWRWAPPRQWVHILEPRIIWPRRTVDLHHSVQDIKIGDRKEVMH
uniref:Uncharacterized protein n=1 Tax=Parascaris univalens TaxID=6257 RepID=A0A915A994_PARUN